VSGNNCFFLVLKSIPVLKADLIFKTIGKVTLESKMEIEVLLLLFFFIKIAKISFKLLQNLFQEQLIKKYYRFVTNRR
jgi:hypothetical protein